MVTDTLPPLPEPAFGRIGVSHDTGRWCEDNRGEPAFDGHQMRAMYAAGLAAGRTPPAGMVRVPVEPTPRMLACIVRRDYPADWEAGKRLQARQRGENRVPFKTEYECAVGQYERLLAAAQQCQQEGGNG